MAERFQVTRGLLWGRIGESASAAAGEAVTPEEFAPDRWAEYVALELVRRIEETPTPAPEPVPEPPPPTAHVEVIAPVDRPPGQSHTEVRVTGGPEARLTPSRHRKRA